MPTDQRLHVFLCHASQDKPIVRALYDALKAEGWIDPWLDEKKLLPGQDWDLENEKAVEKSDAVIVCLSNSSVTKEGYIQKELRFILDIALTKLEDQIFVIPLRFEDCQPPRRLRAFHYVDYFPKAQQASAYQLVLDSLKLRARSLGVNIVKRSRTPLTAEPTPHNEEPLHKKEIVWGDKVTVGDIELIRIPKGKFIMGSDELRGEALNHNMDLPYDYWMGRFPVTNAQFTQYRNRDFVRRTENHPVVEVTWYDAQKYLKWLNQIFSSQLPQGSSFRLPSEAEWEKAARGTDGRTWPWGNTFDKNKCNTREGGKGSTTPVGLYSPQGDSPYGCVDMAGNVSEWTRSLWGPNILYPEYKYPYKVNDGREDEDIGDQAIYMVLRGGAFNSFGWYAQCAHRHRTFPSYRYMEHGFRVVVVPWTRM